MNTDKSDPKYSITVVFAEDFDMLSEISVYNELLISSPLIHVGVIDNVAQVTFKGNVIKQEVQPSSKRNSLGMFCLITLLKIKTSNLDEAEKICNEFSNHIHLPSLKIVIDDSDACYGMHFDSWFKLRQYSETQVPCTTQIKQNHSADFKRIHETRIEEYAKNMANYVCLVNKKK